LRLFRNSHIILLCLLFIVSCSRDQDPIYQYSADEHFDPELRQYFDEALALFNNGKLEKADSVYVVGIERAREAGNEFMVLRFGNERIKKFREVRPDEKDFEFIYEQIRLSDESGFPFHEAYSRYLASTVYYSLNRYEEALNLVEQSREIATENFHPDSEDYNVIMTAVLNSLGAIYARQFMRSESLEVYYQAADLIRNDPDEVFNYATVLNNIGLIYLDETSYDKALERFNEAYHGFKEKNTLMSVAMVLNNMSLTLQALENYDAAIDSLNSAIEIHESSNRVVPLIRTYYNQAMNYIKIEDFETSIHFSTMGYNLSHEINFGPGIMYTAMALGTGNLKSENYDAAIGYFKESYEFITQFNQEDLRVDYYKHMSELYGATGRYEEALNAHRNFFTAASEIEKKTRNTELERIRSQYNFDLQERENELLRNELTYKDQLANIQFIGLLVLGIGLVVALGLASVLIINAKKLRQTHKELHHQNELIKEKNRSLRKLNREKDGLTKLIIHDLKNPLFAMMGCVSMVRNKFKSDEDKRLLMMIDQSANQLKTLIESLLELASAEQEATPKNFSQNNLSKLLAPAIEEFKLMSAMKNIRLESSIEDMVVESNSTYIQRIVENLLSNAVKFTPYGGRVSIDVGKSNDGKWYIRVEDNGQGFSDEDKAKAFKMFQRLSARPTGDESTSGLGLYTVKTLSGKIEGKISLDSEQGKGTVITCTFPAHQVVEGEIKQAASFHYPS